MKTPGIAVLIAIIVFSAAGSRATLAQVPVEQSGNLVRKFFESYCVQCHGTESPEGGVNLVEIGAGQTRKQQAELAIKVHRQLVSREMPPADERQPTKELRRHVLQHLRTRLIQMGEDPDAELRLPGKGNLVNHEALFSADPSSPTASMPRLWRINPDAYENMIRRTAGKNFKASSAFSVDRSGGGFGDYAALYKLDGPSTEQLLRNAQAIAHEQSRYSTYQDSKRITRVRLGSLPEAAKLLAPDAKKPTRAQIEIVVRKQFEKVLLREPTASELRRFADFGAGDIDKLGLRLGLQNLLAAVLLQPDVLYRSETGFGTPDQHGRVRLTAREIAFALAYALTDAPPDGKLLSAAADGLLASRVQVADHVRRMLAEPKLNRSRILKFFREYFDYPSAQAVFKDRELFEQHRADTLVRDTDFLVQHILDQDKHVLYELLTTRKTFVNFNRDSKGTALQARQDRVHESYSLPVDWKWIPDQPIEMPTSQRMGILTQPSWLVAHSDNFDNHVIRRGKWIRERLLGGTIPDLPITVDAQLPEDDHKTLRQRMEVTREAYCWKCHQRMNPLGFPFERYDHFGRYRLREQAQPVDTSGWLDRTTSDLEGKVNNPFDLIERLAESDRVRQVFIRHVFRYFMGRNETVADGPVLAAVDHAYVENDGSFQELLVSLLSSDAFLYRWAAADKQ